MPLTILVVDDDAAVRTAVGDYLEASGYATVTAANGREALAALEKCQPQLLITDAIMPQVDGYELVRQVRLQPSSRLLPVIFLSARSKTEERVRGYQIGCDVYLPKPFELSELGAVVRNLLERYALMVQAAQFSYGESENRRSPPLERSSQGFPEQWAEKSAERLTFRLHLTPREKDVLSVLVEGLSNAEIGERLHLSPRTVEKYVSSLLRKTETSNRAELVRFSIQHQLVF